MYRIGALGKFSAAAACAAFVLALPFLAAAQAATSSDALAATIRAELLSDPRTASLSEAQLDAMVQVLEQQAQVQGVTSSDITWRPVPASTFEPMVAQSPTCGSIPGFLCALNQAFGLDGSDPTIPIGLCITAGILIIVLGIMLERRHRAHMNMLHTSVPMQ